MKKLEIPLLNDCFDHLDAHDVILESIDRKINFYKIKNLQHQVRYEMPDSSVQYKLLQLQEARRALLEMIAESKRQRTELRVEAALCIAPQSTGHALANGTFG